MSPVYNYLSLPIISQILEACQTSLAVTGSDIRAADSAMRNLMELFVNLDLAQLSAIMDSEILPSLMAQSQPDYSPVGDATAGMCLRPWMQQSDNLV